MGARSVWYGVKRFFAWLETKAYKMHIRVLLSRYRSYTPCADLRRRAAQARGAAVAARRLGWSATGTGIHDLMLLPIERVARVLRRARAAGAARRGHRPAARRDPRAPRLPGATSASATSRSTASRARSPAARSQRINLTTALGTSLVNTLFVLDEPSIGLHPRDMGRVIDVMQRLRDAGNSLVVVEHDPQIMFAADRILDIGPGAGRARRRDRLLRHARRSWPAAPNAHGDYLSGRKDAMHAAGRRGPPRPGEPRLLVRGATEHNLQDRRRRDPARPPGLRHRRLGLGQVARWCRTCCTRRCCERRASRPRRRARTASSRRASTSARW